MAAELLEKISPEMRWEITAKILSSLIVMRGENIIAPALGKSGGYISPVLGAEKWKEINMKIFGDGGKQMFPWVKEIFNIPVENAVETAKLYIVVITLLQGPEFTAEVIEESKERAEWRITKCMWWERYNDFKVGPVHRSHCGEAHQAWGGEGCKALNHRIAFKITKARSWGDPYCEAIFEFKEE